MMNATTVPENTPFFSFGPYGILNMTQATGAPAFASYPHFYQGDPRLVAAIEGLNPNTGEHECYLDVEPITGLLVSLVYIYDL